MRERYTEREREREIYTERERVREIYTERERHSHFEMSLLPV